MLAGCYLENEGAERTAMKTKCWKRDRKMCGSHMKSKVPGWHYLWRVVCARGHTTWRRAYNGCRRRTGCKGHEFQALVAADKGFPARDGGGGDWALLEGQWQLPAAAGWQERRVQAASQRWQLQWRQLQWRQLKRRQQGAEGPCRQRANGSSRQEGGWWRHHAQSARDGRRRQQGSDYRTSDSWLASGTAPARRLSTAAET